MAFRNCWMCITARIIQAGTVAIVHQSNSHRNLAWRSILQSQQTGSQGGGYRAGVVLRKSTRGRCSSAT